MKAISGKVRAAVDKYAMIADGDRIAVGVSGGKDSLFLLCALNELSRYYPKKFSLYAVSADPCFNNAETDFSAVAELCEGMGVPYIIKRTDLAKIIFEDRKEKNPCALCAKMRRGILHNVCAENGFNKLALGHHEDDALETFVMNLFYGGRLACFSPVTYLSRKKITAIRPLIFCDEREIRSAVARLNLPVVESACPADGNTAREDAARLIKSLEKDFPDIRAKLFGAMERGGLLDRKDEI